VIVFVGASQTKVNFSTAEALQRMGERAEYVKIAGNGSNALDFHIAFYIGQLAAKDPGAYFHVVSKDTGFDPLIQRLKDKKILAARTRDVAEIPALKANAKPAGDRLAAIVAKLKQLGATKPRTVKTLSSTISAHFQKQLSAEDVAALVTQLQADNLVTVAGSKVSYALSA
jgi:hypothetical protein